MAQRIAIPKTAFSISHGKKRPRKESSNHLAFIRRLSCVICRTHATVQAAHIRTGNQQFGKRETGMGEKSDDCWTLPLCSRHHNEQHALGEKLFWETLGVNINPFVLALALWRATGDEQAGELIISEMRKP